MRAPPREFGGLMILSLAIGTASNNAIQASARATLASGTAILALPLVLDAWLMR